MRTVKRDVRALNAVKQDALRALINAFAAEKAHWLAFFARRENHRQIDKPRAVRDQAIKDGYVPASGLQARLWKLALTEASETICKTWEATLVDVRKDVHRLELSKKQRHYAYWLLRGYQQMFDCRDGAAPKAPFELPYSDRCRVAHRVRDLLKQHHFKNPSINLARSVVLDANCYDVQFENGIQTIAVMGLVPRRRIRLPLLGVTAISGNVRIVMDDRTVRLHVAYDLAKHGPLPALSEDDPTVVGIDAGYTEVLTDDQGASYGEGLGPVLTQATSDRHGKGQKRNKLRALADKYAERGSIKARRKARLLKRFNLGKQKWESRERKVKATLECTVNRAYNALIAQRKVTTVVSEDLSHAFPFDHAPKVNRMLSNWIKGRMATRLEFKSKAEGFRQVIVNAAYSSQACPSCDFVERTNRKQDAFVCQSCGFASGSDHVGARNVRARAFDKEITAYTPVPLVKRILLARHQRRLEKGDLTVPGKTPETVQGDPQRPAKPKAKRGGAKGAAYPSVTRRANANKGNLRLGD